MKGRDGRAWGNLALLLPTGLRIDYSKEQGMTSRKHRSTTALAPRSTASSPGKRKASRLWHLAAERGEEDARAGRKAMPLRCHDECRAGYVHGYRTEQRRQPRLSEPGPA